MTRPDLYTPNLRLVFFDKSKESHYANIFASYNDPHVIEQRGKIVNSYADIDARGKFSIPPELCHKSPPPEYTFVLCFINDTDTYVGQISAHFRGEDRTSPENTEMGWAFLQEYWGRGFATEAAVAIVKWCDEVLGLERISASCAVSNIASCRVAEKAGGRIRESRTDCEVDTERSGMRQYEWVFQNSG